MAPFGFKKNFQGLRKSLPSLDLHQEPHRQIFFENRCRLLADHLSIARKISLDDTLCTQLAKLELQRVVKLGESLIEECQRISALKARLYQKEKSKAFEELLKEILWDISVVLDHNKGSRLNLSTSEIIDHMLPVKEEYLLQCAAIADEKALQASLRIWIEEHLKCSAEECGGCPREQEPDASPRLCLATQIAVRNGEAFPAIDQNRFSLWITAQVALEDLKKPIGKGSFGTVFETKWLGDSYAKKEFCTHCEDFEDEINSLAKLNHGHIVNVLACSEFKSSPCFFLMEKFPDNLRSYMQKRMEKLRGNSPFSVMAGIDLMLQLSEAMSYVNSLHMVHRDLKAENILVKPVDNSEGFVVAKLADFGLAKVKHEVTSRMTRNTGTRLYMAPEVYGTHSYDKPLPEVYPWKPDVYSYGIVCSEIWTGNAPFCGVLHGQSELYSLITKVDPLRPKLPESCPESVAALIRECWHTDPVIRPSFTEISATLRYFKALLMMGEEGKLTHSESSGFRNMIRADGVQTKREEGLGRGLPRAGRLAKSEPEDSVFLARMNEHARLLDRFKAQEAELSVLKLKLKQVQEIDAINAEEQSLMVEIAKQEANSQKFENIQLRNDLEIMKDEVAKLQEITEEKDAQLEEVYAQHGNELQKMQTECRQIHDGFRKMKHEYLEVKAERDALAKQIRN